jgi:hypothetical protein
MRSYWSCFDRLTEAGERAACFGLLAAIREAAAEPKKEGEVWRGPSGRFFTLKKGRVVPAKDPDKKAPEKKPRPPAKPKPEPEPKPKPAAPAASPQQARIQAAAKKDLADPSHPINKYRGQLATANFGSGDVRTIRGTKDHPLSAADHQAMDRAHSRTAAALKLAGNEQGAKAQLEAAQYHRGLAQRKGAPAPAAAKPAPAAAPPAPAVRKGTDPARDPAKAPVRQKFMEKLQSAGFPPEEAKQRAAHVDLGRKLQEYHGVQVPPGGAVGAFVVDRSPSGGRRASLHLDGVEDESGLADVDSDTLSASVAKGHSQVQGTYAHEMTHAIDGPDHEHSNSREWQSAFAQEISQQRAGKYGGKTWRLSEYASGSASEGFAEFGRLLYSTDVDHETIKKSMPKSYQYFRSQGLI